MPLLFTSSIRTNFERSIVFDPAVGLHRMQKKDLHSFSHVSVLLDFSCILKYALVSVFLLALTMQESEPRGFKGKVVYCTGCILGRPTTVHF